MLRRLLSALAFALLTVTCALPQAEAGRPRVSSYTLHLDPKLTPEQQGIIVAGFRDWQVGSGNVVTFDVSADPFPEELPDKGKCTGDVWVISFTAKQLRELDMSSNTLAFATQDCRLFVVAFVMERLNDPNVLRHVAVHESGHTLGLDHIPVPHESVMYPSIDLAAPGIAQLDWKQFCHLHGCDPTSLPAP